MEDRLARVRAAYERNPEREWARLESGAQNRLEYLITTYALARHLARPARAIRILDAGGGPGRYTLWLAERGHRVTLLDLSPSLLGLARRHLANVDAQAQACVEGIVEGSFTDLSAFPDASFDAVLCLGGAFSHLIERTDQRQALVEFRRVMRPEGLLLVNALNYVGQLRAVVQWWPDRQTIEIFRRLLAGTVIDVGEPGAPAYSFRPEELVGLLGEVGLRIERLYGSEGIGAHLQEEHLLGVMEDRELWPAWRDALLATADHPNVVGVSRSLLAVARR